MSQTESHEMYLKAIFRIEERQGYVRNIDIAKELGISKPSVTNAVERLRKAGDVEIADNHVRLTAIGRERAERIVMRYNTLVEMLTYMDIPQDKAEGAACKMEHDLDDETFYGVKLWLHKQKMA